MSSLRRLLLPPALLFALSCGEEAPDPCTRMCASAAELYGGCLEGWGLGWDAAGYDDAEDFVESCETWAWEMRLLEEDAVQMGDLKEPGATDAACRQRRARFSAEDASCDDFTDLDWSTPPWELP